MTKLHTIEDIQDALEPSLGQIEMHILDNDLPAEHFTESCKALFEARAEFWARQYASLHGAHLATLVHLWGFNEEDNFHWKRTTYVLLKPETRSIVGKDDDGDYIAIPIRN